MIVRTGESDVKAAKDAAHEERRQKWRERQFPTERTLVPR